MKGSWFMGAGIVLLLISFVGCRSDIVGTSNNANKVDDAAVRVSDHFVGRVGTTIDEPGAIHNEILAAAEQRFSKVTDGRLPRGRFVPLFVDAANEVCAAHGLPDRCDASDVEVMLDYFDALRTAGVYDFYGQKTSYPAYLLDFLYDRDLLTGTEYNEMLAIFQYDADRSAVESAALTSDHSGAAADVFSASREFWSSRDPAVKAVSKNASEGPSFIDWYSLGIIAADAAGIIVIDVWLSGGVTVTVTIGGALASATFVSLASCDWGTMCHDIDGSVTGFGDGLPPTLP